MKYPLYGSPEKIVTNKLMPSFPHISQARVLPFVFPMCSSLKSSICLLIFIYLLFICGLRSHFIFILNINSPRFNCGAQEQTIYNITENVRFMVKNRSTLKTNHIIDTHITNPLRNLNQIRALIPLSFSQKQQHLIHLLNKDLLCLLYLYLGISKIDTVTVLSGSSG